MKALKRAVLAPDTKVRNTEIDGTVFSEAQQGGRRLVSIRRADGSKANVVIGGTRMSGPIFLDDRSFRDFAFQKWHARIHEMEGTAIAQVGYSNRVPILIVRALSDLAGGQKGVNQEERNSQLAASNAAEVTAKILERIESAQ